MFEKYKIKTIATITGALVAFGLAYLSYQYLAFKLFWIGIKDFYKVAPTVTDECREVVADAAIAFTGVYDYIGLVVSAVFFISAVYLAWQAFSSRTT